MTLPVTCFRRQVMVDGRCLTTSYCCCIFIVITSTAVVTQLLHHVGAAAAASGHVGKMILDRARNVLLDCCAEMSLYSHILNDTALNLTQILVLYTGCNHHGKRNAWDGVVSVRLSVLRYSNRLTKGQHILRGQGTFRTFCPRVDVLVLHAGEERVGEASTVVIGGESSEAAGPNLLCDVATYCPPLHVTVGKLTTADTTSPAWELSSVSIYEM